MTKSDQDKALILRAAGYSNSAIAVELNYSVKTICRLFAKSAPIKRNELKDRAIEQAKIKLANDAAFIGDIKNKIAGAIVDDLAIAAKLREQISITLEGLADDETGHHSSKARTLAALSTSLSVTQQAIRKALNIDSTSINEQIELPTLTIYKMTDDDVKAVREMQENPDL